jgi:hypothetical protein
MSAAGRIEAVYVKNKETAGEGAPGVARDNYSVT